MSSIVSPPELPAFNLSVAHRPGRVVPIGTAAELPGVVMEAARAGERIRPVGSGHGLVTPVDGGLALLTRDLDGVEIDPVARAARVGAGVGGPTSSPRRPSTGWRRSAARRPGSAWSGSCSAAG